MRSSSSLSNSPNRKVGGAVGAAKGTVVGAIVGLVPAIFTFGLSIPAGAAIGGTIGAMSGAASGSTPEEEELMKRTLSGSRQEMGRTLSQEMKRGLSNVSEKAKGLVG